MEALNGNYLIESFFAFKNSIFLTYKIKLKNIKFAIIVESPTDIANIFFDKLLTNKLATCCLNILVSHN